MLEAIEEEQSYKNQQQDADCNAEYPHHETEAPWNYRAGVEVGVVTRISGGILPMFKTGVMRATLIGFPSWEAFAPSWPCPRLGSSIGSFFRFTRSRGTPWGTTLELTFTPRIRHDLWDATTAAKVYRIQPAI